MKTKLLITAKSFGRWYLSVALLAALGLVGCAGTTPTLGGSQSAVTGSAGGAGAQGASSQLERCDESLGTLAVVEDQAASWYGHLSQYKLGSTVPVLRMMIQQSNCFVVVERGRAMQQHDAGAGPGENRRDARGQQLRQRTDGGGRLHHEPVH